MVGPVGSVGGAGDKAAMESCFSLLQKNVLDLRRWDTPEELRIAIVAWIERTYHRRGRQGALGRLTPIEFEAIMTTRPVGPHDGNGHQIVRHTPADPLADLRGDQADDHDSAAAEFNHDRGSAPDAPKSRRVRIR
ncbi:integrase catalytic subunit [Mycobacterium triplex]|uniref:Integrase catalytic subunit n=1 Tax=Mycobacterium triplex TaxID=47839 RepID=A0A024JTL1_9MYCO|nr:integrase catalytic subunit [Mycobacterium triplex]